MTAVAHPTKQPVAVPMIGSVPGPQKRITSVDALRGFDMFWIMGPEGGHWIVTSFAILLVGHVPAWLKYELDHPSWRGFSAWDMIMPLFLFIVGVAMPFSMARRLEQGRSSVYLRALRRV